MPQPATVDWSEFEAVSAPGADAAKGGVDWSEFEPVTDTTTKEGYKLAGPESSPLMMMGNPARPDVAAEGGEEGSALDIAMRPLVHLPRPDVSPDASTAKKIGAGVLGGVESLAEGFTSPVGLVTLGLGALPRAAQKALSLAFAGQMVAQTPQIATELGTEFGKPAEQRDVKKIAELITSAAGTTGFTVGAGLHGLAPAETPAAAAARMLGENVKGKDFGPVRVATPEPMISAVNKVSTGETPALPTGEPNASENEQAAEVHGDVRAQPEQGAGQVPVEESGARVRPDAKTKTGEVLLSSADQEHLDYDRRQYFHGLSGDRLAEYEKTGKIPSARQAFGGEFSITDDYDLAKQHAGEGGRVIKVHLEPGTDVEQRNPHEETEPTGSQVEDIGEGEYVVHDRDALNEGEPEYKQHVSDAKETMVNLGERPTSTDQYEILPADTKDPLGEGFSHGKFYLTPDGRWISVEEHEDAAMQLLGKEAKLSSSRNLNPNQFKLESTKKYLRVLDEESRLYFTGNPVASQVAKLMETARQYGKELVMDDPEAEGGERVLYTPPEISGEAEPAKVTNKGPETVAKPTKLKEDETLFLRGVLDDAAVEQREKYEDIRLSLEGSGDVTEEVLSAADRKRLAGLLREAGDDEQLIQESGFTKAKANQLADTIEKGHFQFHDEDEVAGQSANTSAANLPEGEGKGAASRLQELTTGETGTPAEAAERAKLDAQNKVGNSRAAFEALATAKGGAPIPKPEVKAVAKVKAQVTKVAKTEGTRSAVEIKNELVDKLGDAVKNAPEVSEKGAHKKITINIPGDGDFTVFNNKQDLGTVLKEARALDTRSTTPVKKVPTGRPDSDKSVANAIAAYGSPDAAYAAVKRQIAGLPEDEAEAKQQAQDFADKIYQQTTAGKLDIEAEGAARSARMYDRDLAIYEKKMARIEGLKKQTAAHQRDLKDLSARIESGRKKQAIFERSAKEFRRQADEARAKLEGTAPPAEPPTKPIVGMGGAVPGEFTKGYYGTFGAGADIYGIAERVRKARAQAGEVDPVSPGQGIAPADSVEHGRDLVAQGADPERVMRDFEATKRLNADDMAVARAHGEQLAKAKHDIEIKHGTASDEFARAYVAESAWDQRSKVMQTEWAKTGQAQQGETDIDTGSFSGLQRAFKQDTDKDFTPAQEKVAKDKAGKVKAAQDAAVAARDKLFAEADKVAGSGADAQTKSVWAKAKDYVNQGWDDFDDIRQKVSTDLGMKVDEVTKAMARNKATKRLADDLWRKQQIARRLSTAAKLWLKTQQMPKLERALAAVPRTLFSLKVGFHGTVALGTHAPMVAFQPPFWATYIRDFGKMYKMVGLPTPDGQRSGAAYYERQVQDLLRRPNFITARRAGLVNDPYTFEDFNSPQMSEFMGQITGMGNRGYAVLKILRQDMFDQHWNNLPETARIPEVASAIADGVNHATGVVKTQAPKGAHLAIFAPRLEMSRAAWLYTDPVRAIKTFANWKNAPDAEKNFAVQQVKEKAWVAGTMFGLLALNQGALSATGSKQKINFTNPMQSDWLKFKAAGMDASYGNAMLNMIRLPSRLVQIRESNGGKLKNLVYPDESSYTALGEYARSQLSPAANIGADLMFKGDWQNRPLPGSNRPVPKRLAAQGVKPYTWTEFWSEQLLPIPMEEMVRQVWKTGLGMSPEQIKTLEKSVGTAMVMGGTGGRVEPDTAKK